MSLKGLKGEKAMYSNCEKYQVFIVNGGTYQFSALNDETALKTMNRRFGKNVYFTVVNLRTGVCTNNW